MIAAILGAIYITAAHIDPSTLHGFKLLYVDKEKDTAYYLKEDYEYTLPSIGDKVYTCTMEGTVVETVSSYGFFITLPTVYKGMSGARVKNADNKDIAFISYCVGKKVFCVCLE